MSTRAGFHAGEIHAKRGRIDDKYIHHQKLYKKEDFNVTSLGTAAAPADQRSAELYPIQGYSFANRVDTAVGITTVVPSSVPSDAKADVTLYWTMSGAASGKVSTGVVWDVDYRTIQVLVSGVDAGGKYSISGAWSNATTNGFCYTGPGMISGALASSVVTVPSADVKPNSILQMEIRRDVGETADNLDAEAILLFAVLEYVKS